MPDHIIWVLIVSGWIAAALIYLELRLTRELVDLEAHDAFVTGFQTCSMEQDDEVAEEY